MTLAKLYTKCLFEKRIPTAWKTAKMVIIEGNKNDLKNFRPICILSNIYKVLTKVLMKRLEKTLDEKQPRELTGFRSRYSMIDYIHAANQLKEKCKEYNIPPCIAFVDYEKAFDSVQTQAVLTSLQEQRIVDVYIDLLKEICSPLTQRKQQDKHQERSMTGRYHIAQAIYGSTRKQIPTTNLGNQKLEDRRRIS